VRTPCSLLSWMSENIHSSTPKHRRKKSERWRRRSASPPSDLAGQTRALRASSTHVGPRVPRVRPHSARAWCGTVEHRWQLRDRDDWGGGPRLGTTAPGNDAQRLPQGGPTARRTPRFPWSDPSPTARPRALGALRAPLVARLRRAGTPPPGGVLTRPGNTRN